MLSAHGNDHMFFVNEARYLAGMVAKAIKTGDVSEIKKHVDRPYCPDFISNMIYDQIIGTISRLRRKHDFIAWLNEKEKDISFGIEDASDSGCTATICIHELAIIQLFLILDDRNRNFFITEVRTKRKEAVLKDMMSQYTKNRVVF